jgi:hypothetical protein
MEVFLTEIAEIKTSFLSKTCELAHIQLLHLVLELIMLEHKSTVHKGL